MRPLKPGDFASMVGPSSNGEPISAEEAEKILLEKLKKCEQELERTISDLAFLYGDTGRADMGIQYLDRLVAYTADPERKALYLLKMGAVMESVEDYKAAVTFYAQALSLEPVGIGLSYFINNNLGYCLNQIERHAEAEPYCRAAIEIEPLRHNAYKNLGRSLEGQGQFKEAAEFYIRAVQTNAADPRALIHLEDLVASHRELLADVPDIQAQIKKCRELVHIVLRRQDQINEGSNKETIV